MSSPAPPPPEQPGRDSDRPQGQAAPPAREPLSGCGIALIVLGVLAVIFVVFAGVCITMFS